MVEGACHSDCSGHTRTLEPHTDDSWPHATCLDTPGILMILKLNGGERREIPSLKISALFFFFPCILECNARKKNFATNFVQLIDFLIFFLHHVEIHFPTKLIRNFSGFCKLIYNVTHVKRLCFGFNLFESDICDKT